VAVQFVGGCPELRLEIDIGAIGRVFGLEAVAFFHRFFACLDSLWLAVWTVANSKVLEKVKIGVGVTEA
jgi:hypothetical protein